MADKKNTNKKIIVNNLNKRIKFNIINMSIVHAQILNQNKLFAVDIISNNYFMFKNQASRK